MIVYIEDVAICSLCISMLICLIVYRVRKKKINLKKCLFASVAGCLTDIVFPLVQNVFLKITLIVLHIVTVVIILFIGEKSIVIDALVLFAVTFLVGGIELAVFYLLPQYFFKQNLIVFVIGIGVVTYIVVKKLLYYVFTDVQVRKCKILFSFDNTDVELDALVDSGNFLFDDKSGLPVVVVYFPSILKYSKARIDKLIQAYKLNNRSVKCSTVSGEIEIPLISVKNTYVKIDGNKFKKDFIIGVSTHKIVNCDCLIGSIVLEGIKC